MFKATGRAHLSDRHLIYPRFAPALARVQERGAARSNSLKGAS
jgi:hypothetical protein